MHYLSHTLMSAMIPMKGFLSKAYLPMMRVICEAGLAEEISLPSKVPGAG